MKDFTLLALHHPGFLIRLVIVPQKVQKAMYDEMSEVVFERLSFFRRLALDSFACNDDIAQHGSRLRTGLNRKGWKGQNIRRLVLATPFGIQNLYGGVVSKDNTQFTFCTSVAKIVPGSFNRLPDKPLKARFIRPVAGLDHDIDVDRVV